MAYPESIPTLKGKDAIEFLRKLNKFKLNKSQRNFLKGAKEEYRKSDIVRQHS